MMGTVSVERMLAMGEAGARHLLFVAGMHRAGTSALCAALHACGVDFGQHLLEPMAGVNDAGFWESTEVVALNEQLLAISGFEWFSVTQRISAVDWTSDEFAGCRVRARELLSRGFGNAKVEAVKDPRFCLTLPFWLQLCEELDLRFSVCVMQREPLEIAQSLSQRDAFPLGYGLRLQAIYLRTLLPTLPEHAHWLTYPGLLAEPSRELGSLLSVLGLIADDNALRSALREDLRHQRARELASDAGLAAPTDRQAYDAALERAYPVEETLSDFASRLVARGRELTRIGTEHSRALATLDERDADLSRLASEHTKALMTLDERDAQIETLSENEARLKSIFAKPLIGLVFRAMWKYETR